MRIYHGSDVVVKTPKILAANRLLDFGEQILFHTTKSLDFCKYADVQQI